MKEKLKEILLMARSSEAGEGEIPFEDFWSDQILTLICEEIEKRLLTGGEITAELNKLGEEATYGSGLKAVAQAQLDKVLKILT